MRRSSQATAGGGMMCLSRIVAYRIRACRWTAVAKPYDQRPAFQSGKHDGLNRIAGGRATYYYMQEGEPDELHGRIHTNIEFLRQRRSEA
eukprot:6624103-Pyramimonas_sp.AAC.1